MNRKITKVRDLLRESQESFYSQNNKNLDKVFNMEMPSPKNASGNPLDNQSHQYFERIRKIREKQKRLLPLYLESKKLVNRHKKCMSVILNENEAMMPYQIQRVLEKGREGLDGYLKLLSNIETILNKNNALTEQLDRY